MQTHANNPRLGLGFDVCPFDLVVSACWGSAMDYVSTDFGADSSSRFPIRALTDRQTDAIERRTPLRQLHSRRE